MKGISAESSGRVQVIEARTKNGAPHRKDRTGGGLSGGEIGGWRRHGAGKARNYYLEKRRRSRMLITGGPFVSIWEKTILRLQKKEREGEILHMQKM